MKGDLTRGKGLASHSFSTYKTGAEGTMVWQRCPCGAERLLDCGVQYVNEAARKHCPGAAKCPEPTKRFAETKIWEVLFAFGHTDIRKRFVGESATEAGDHASVWGKTNLDGLYSICPPKFICSFLAPIGTPAPAPVIEGRREPFAPIPATLEVSSSSIELRDHFAGLAMQAILANPGTGVALRLLGVAELQQTDVVAAAAYANADAMLKARENKS